MHSLDPIPAVRRVETDRSNCCAFDIVGHVDAADIENLLGLLEGAFMLHRHVDLLLRLTEHDGVDWPEVAEETLAEGRDRIAKHVRRLAVVGDVDQLTGRKGYFAHQPDLEIRHFTTADESEAWQWLGASPLPPEKV